MVGRNNTFPLSQFGIWDICNLIKEKPTLGEVRALLCQFNHFQLYFSLTESISFTDYSVELQIWIRFLRLPELLFYELFVYNQKSQSLNILFKISNFEGRGINSCSKFYIRTQRDTKSVP